MIIDKNFRIKIREKYKMNFLMMFRSIDGGLLLRLKL